MIVTLLQNRAGGPPHDWRERVDELNRFMQCSCMSKTITIDDDAYRLLRKLKQGAADSFTKVIRRHIIAPADTAGELLEAMEAQPPPIVDLAALDRIERERGRRSGGRK